MDDKPQIDLKFGTIRAWSGMAKGSASLNALQKYADISGISMSVMGQPRTQEHQNALCDVVDAVIGEGGVIYDDWNGEEMTQSAAKEYLQRYVQDSLKD